MKMMNQLWASCWTCLLLSMLLCEPVLCKGGRGGSRGSTGRSSPVRVAAAAAAGAAVAVALTADGWYASAYRRTKAGSSEEDLDYYNNNNNTNYFDALMSRSTQNVSSLTQVVSIIIATFSPAYGAIMDSIFY